MQRHKLLIIEDDADQRDLGHAKVEHGGSGSFVRRMGRDVPVSGVHQSNLMWTGPRRGPVHMREVALVTMFLKHDLQPDRLRSS